MTNKTDNVGWRGELALIAFRQGPSFVVLILILYAIWSFFSYLMKEGVPTHLRQIQEGYQVLQEKNDKSLTDFQKATTTTLDNFQKTTVTLIEGLREENTKIGKEINKAVESISAHEKSQTELLDKISKKLEKQ